MSQPLTPEKAIEHYTELQRRVSVGAYLELQHDGSYPEDDGSPEATVIESLDNLDRWAQRQALVFTTRDGAWVLEPIPREGECLECERYSHSLSVLGYCEGCIMQQAIDAMEPEWREK